MAEKLAFGWSRHPQRMAVPETAASRRSFATVKGRSHLLPEAVPPSRLRRLPATAHPRRSAEHEARSEDLKTPAEALFYSS